MHKKLFLFFLVVPISFFNVFSQDSTEVVLPTTTLLKKSGNSSFSISPDGKYFAQIINDAFNSDIVIVAIDEYKLFKKFSYGRTEVTGLKWLTSERIVYEVKGEIKALDIDGSNPTVIINELANKEYSNWSNYYRNIRYNSVLSLKGTSPDDILVESMNFKGYSDILAVNIYTGQQAVVVDGSRYKVNKWIVDVNGEPQIALRYGKDKISFFEFSRDFENLHPLVLAIGNELVPLEITGSSYLDQKLSIEAFGYEENMIYMTSSVGTDKRKLIKYDIKNRRVVDVLAEDLNCDVMDPHGKGVALIFDHKNKKLAGIQYEGILPQFKWYSQDYKAVQDELNRVYPGYVHEIVDVDSQNNRYVIHQWSDFNAGNIGIYDSKEDSYAVMFHFNPTLNSYKLSRTKSVIIEARDGHKVPSYINVPNDYDGTKEIPLVVIPHGGPWARDYWEFDPFAQFFTSRGYAVLKVNYRGSSGFGRAHIMAGIENMDKVMIDDIADATQFIQQNYSIRPSGTYIYGHSYGGYATYMCLLKYPKLYSAGVAVSAPSDIKKWMKEKRKEGADFTVDFWERALGSKSSSYLKEISPVTYAKEISQPIMIVHGKYDKTISVEHSRTMANILKKSGKRVWLEVLQNEGHSIRDGNALGYLLIKAERFFKKY
ncbi:MAG: dipeptidyl aminopeptidase/acylaminoacyl peptidase [Flavobacteriales bacterium]|jgi:dipeptidyl aminopeptidase/acylaminoacyl peptidase